MTQTDPGPLPVIVEPDGPRRLRPVRALDIVLVSNRLTAAAQDAMGALIYSGKDSAGYQQHQRTYNRRVEALRRLAYALERQGGEQR